MSTSDDSFRAEGPGLFGFLTDSNDDNVPVKAFGTVGYAPNVGVLGFSGIEADPEGPIQQNGYSQRAGVEGGSVGFTGTAGVSLNRVGVYGQVEDSPPVPTGLRAGVLGVASTQPGIIGFARDGDGAQGLSFSGIAIRAASFFGPGVHSISGALTGVTGISGTNGPTIPNPNLPNIAGVIGSSDGLPGVVGTSRVQVGVYGFSSNTVGVVGQTSNAASFAGAFLGNVHMTGTLTSDSVKGAVVPFPDGTKRLLVCMESPEPWFEDFGTANLKGGRALVKLDADFAKVITRGYRVFLTPEGECRGLSVRRKTAASFEVRELMGGKSSVAFSYRIVGRRKDIKGYRRFAKIDTRLRLPAPARLPRKRAPASAALRAFVARLEQEARERAPKAARKVGRSRAPKRWSLREARRATKQ
jgi:hypothetical protein